MVCALYWPGYSRSARKFGAGPCSNASICIGAVAAIATWLSSPVAAQTPGDCGTLEDLKIEDTNLLSSTVVPAADDLPEYCRVLGYVRPGDQLRDPSADHGPGTASSTWPAAARGAARWKPTGRASPTPPITGSAATTPLSTMDGGHWGATRWDATLDSGQGPDRPLRLRAAGRHGDRAGVQGGDRGLLRQSAREVVLRGLLHRRPPGEHGGLEVPRGLRRHHQRLPVAVCRQGTTAWAWNVKANMGPDGGRFWTLRSCRCSPRRFMTPAPARMA